METLSANNVDCFERPEAPRCLHLLFSKPGEAYTFPNGGLTLFSNYEQQLFRVIEGVVAPLKPGFRFEKEGFVLEYNGIHIVVHDPKGVSYLDAMVPVEYRRESDRFRFRYSEKSHVWDEFLNTVRNTCLGALVSVGLVSIVLDPAAVLKQPCVRSDGMSFGQEGEAEDLS